MGVHRTARAASRAPARLAEQADSGNPVVWRDPLAPRVALARVALRARYGRPRACLGRGCRVAAVHGGSGAGPALERAVKRARLRESEHEGHLADANPILLQIALGELAAGVVEDVLEGGP